MTDPAGPGQRMAVIGLFRQILQLSGRLHDLRQIRKRGEAFFNHRNAFRNPQLCHGQIVKIVHNLRQPGGKMKP